MEKRYEGTLEALTDIFGRGKLSTIQVSQAMGRSGTYISSMIGRGSVPSADIMAEIADAIGCDLLLRKRDDHDEAYVIDPPKRGE